MANLFFKDGSKWVIKCESGIEYRVSAGDLSVGVDDDNIFVTSKFNLSGGDDDVLFKNLPVTEIDKDRVGTPYDDVDDFFTTNDNFFVKALGDGGFKYSHDEESTGKTWLDGKTIYRRTFDVPTSPVADSLVSIPLGFSVGNFFKILDGGVQRSETFLSDYVPLPFVDQRDGYNIQVSSTPAKDTIVVNNGLLSEHVGGWITLEYTKA